MGVREVRGAKFLLDKLTSQGKAMFSKKQAPFLAKSKIIILLTVPNINSTYLIGGVYIRTSVLELTSFRIVIIDRDARCEFC